MPNIEGGPIKLLTICLKLYMKYIWGFVWWYHLDSLSLYGQCERDVGLGEQHLLECRLQPALIIYNRDL